MYTCACVKMPANTGLNPYTCVETGLIMDPESGVQPALFDHLRVEADSSAEALIPGKLRAKRNRRDEPSNLPSSVAVFYYFCFLFIRLHFLSSYGPHILLVHPLPEMIKRICISVAGISDGVGAN